MAFNKKRADDRKDLLPLKPTHIPQTRMRRYAWYPNAWFFLQEWINEADDEEYVDHSKDQGEICSVLLADLYVTHETVL